MDQWLCDVLECQPGDLLRWDPGEVTDERARSTVSA